MSNFFIILYFVFFVLTLFVYIIRYKQTGEYGKFIILLMALWLIISATAIYLFKYAGVKNNLYLFHISTPIEYVLICLIYMNAISGAWLKKFVYWSMPVYVLLCIIFSSFIEKPDTNNSSTGVIESVLLVLISLLFLRETLVLQQVEDLKRYPMFWISVGVLAYYLGTLLIEGLYNYLVSRSIELATKVYKIEHVFKYLLFVLFIVAAFCNGRKQDNLKTATT